MTDIDSSRRKFLISSAAGIGGLVIAQSSLAGTVTNLLDPGSPLMLPENFSPSVWCTMQSSGETTIHVFRQELGQHIGTAFAQIIAEELELDWSKVSIDYPSVDAAIVAELELSGEEVKSEPPPKPAAVPEPQLPSRSVKALYTQDVE